MSGVNLAAYSNPGHCFGCLPCRVQYCNEGDALAPCDAACICWFVVIRVCQCGRMRASALAVSGRCQIEPRRFALKNAEPSWGTVAGATHAMAVHIDFSDTRQEGLTRHPLCPAELVCNPWKTEQGCLDARQRVRGKWLEPCGCCQRSGSRFVCCRLLRKGLGPWREQNAKWTEANTGMVVGQGCGRDLPSGIPA